MGVNQEVNFSFPTRLSSRERKVNFVPLRASFLGEKAKRTEEKSFLDAAAIATE